MYDTPQSSPAEPIPQPEPAPPPPPKKKRNYGLWIFLVVMLCLVCLFAGLVYAVFAARQDISGGAPPSDGGGSPPASGAVTIESFSVSPERIPAGQCVQFSWSVKNADTVSLSRDGGVIADPLELSGSHEECHDAAGIFRYRLDASSEGGTYYNWSELQVIVD